MCSSSIGIILYIWTFNAIVQIGQSVKLHGSESKLILFQGTNKFEILGKDCPVGIAFAKPQRFSCACVTGLWAFYSKWCDVPMKVVGGVDYCFVMPPARIQQVMIWSNPSRVLDSTLTVFEGNEDYVKAKLYRNTHMTISNSSNFVTTNSSWTLLHGNGTKVCLNSGDRPDAFDEDTVGNDKLDFLPNSYFCHFSQVNSRIADVATFTQGCTRRIQEIKPDSCEYFKSPNGEFICLKSEVLANFAMPAAVRVRATSTIRTITTKVPLERINLKETGMNLEEFVDIEETTEANGWTNHYDASWKRDKKSVNTATAQMSLHLANNSLAHKSLRVPLKVVKIEPVHTVSSTAVSIFIDFPLSSEKPSIANRYPFSASSSIEDMELESENRLSEFLTFDDPPQFNPVIKSNLFSYHKDLIYAVLNVKQEDDSTLDQVFQLLNISKIIMQKSCSLVPAQFFDQSFQIFVNVLRDDVNWNPPLVPNFLFQRIRHSLRKCWERIQPFDFWRDDAESCRVSRPSKVRINGTVHRLVLAEVFNSTGFEPMIETVWKIVVNAHSYCYADFSHFYNDHHQFTTLLTKIFTNGIHDIWFRNSTLPEEYNGITGNVQDLLENIERCTAATRLISAYPWNLSRPQIRLQRRRRDVRSKKIRVQLPVHLESTKQAHLTKSSLTKTKHEEEDEQLPVIPSTPAFAEDHEWKSSRSVHNGMGFCLKKFDEPKMKLNRICQ